MVQLFLSGVLTVGASASAVVFAWMIVGIARSMRGAKLASEGLMHAPAADAAPKVCVIVPAHNEARVIERVVRSTLSQDYPRLRAVFALDRCTDRTRSIIEEIVHGDDRVEIIEIAECPEDWAGKTNALRSGVRDSRAACECELLLFIDADTELAPTCVRAAVGLLCSEKLDLVSLMPTLARRTWFERIAQPSAVFELMRENPLHRVNRERRRRSFANGQFLLFRRSSYEALGGHERVKEALLEDLAFAQALKDDGGRWGVYFAGKLMHCRMYGSWEAFRRGWKRIFIESSHRKPVRLRQYARQMRLALAALPALAWLSLGVGAGAWIAFGGAVWIVTAGAGAAGATLWAIAMALIYRAQGAGLLWIFASPVGAWMVAGVLEEAADDLAHNRGVAWGGRVYTDLMASARNERTREG